MKLSFSKTKLNIKYLIIFPAFWGSLNAQAGVSEHIRCMSIYALKPSPYENLTEQKVPNFFTSLFSSEGRSARKAAINNNLTLENVANSSQKNIQEAKSKLKTIGMYGFELSSYKEKSAQLISQFEKVLNDKNLNLVRDEALIKFYKNQLEIRSKSLVDDYNKSLEIVKKFKVSTDKFQEQSLNNYVKVRLQKSIEIELAKVGSSPDAIHALINSEASLGYLEKELKEFNSHEKKRAEVERRFNLKAAETSHQILDSYKELLLQNNSKELADFISQNEFAVLGFMKTADIKQFLYSEMQLYRRLTLLKSKTKSPEKQAQIEELISLHQKNNLSALKQSVIKKSNAPLFELLGLRKSVLNLNKAGIFSGFNLHAGLKLSPNDREKLISSSLEIEEVRFALMGSLLENPTAPTPPKFTKKTKSGQEEYKINLSIYAKEKQEYLNRYMEIKKKRDMYRSSLFVFVSRKFPHAFTADKQTVTDSNKLISESVQIATLKMKPAEKNTLTKRVTRYESRADDTSTTDFLMMFYTGNPMWIINRDIAVIQLGFDLINHPTRSTQYYLSHNLLPEDISQSKTQLEIDNIKTQSLTNSDFYKSSEDNSSFQELSTSMDQSYLMFKESQPEHLKSDIITDLSVQDIAAEIDLNSKFLETVGDGDFSFKDLNEIPGLTQDSLRDYLPSDVATASFEDLVRTESKFESVGETYSVSQQEYKAPETTYSEPSTTTYESYSSPSDSGGGSWGD